jgi:dolichol kinase
VVTLTVFQRPVAALALFYVAVGDPAAGIVGTRYGHTRLPWPKGLSRTKSLEGTLAFSAAALGVALVLWAGGVYSVLWPAVAGALAAALVELLPIPIEDNVSVPLASAAVMGILWVA